MRAPPRFSVKAYYEMIYRRILFHVFGNNRTNNFSFENGKRLKNDVVFLFLVIWFKQFAAYNMIEQMSCDMLNNAAIIIWMMVKCNFHRFQIRWKIPIGIHLNGDFPSQLKIDANFVSFSSKFELSDLSRFKILNVTRQLCCRCMRTCLLRFGRHK